ncbi:hypothetical protein BKA80DRAFT_282484 [Phyllosticta citrichinensis]
MDNGRTDGASGSPPTLLGMAWHGMEWNGMYGKGLLLLARYGEMRSLFLTMVFLFSLFSELLLAPHPKKSLAVLFSKLKYPTSCFLFFFFLFYFFFFGSWSSVVIANRGCLSWRYGSYRAT